MPLQRLASTEVQPETERFNFFSKGTYADQPDHAGVCGAGILQDQDEGQRHLGANNDGGVFLPGDPFNPLFVHGPMNSSGRASRQHVRRRSRRTSLVPYELGGRDQETDNEVFRGLVGLEGTAFGWDYDTGLLYVKSKLKNDNFGFIIYDRCRPR